MKSKTGIERDSATPGQSHYASSRVAERAATTHECPWSSVLERGEA
jgi:hypothetical protein